MKVLRPALLLPVGRVDEQFEFRDPRNLLVGELGDDSQFEVGSCRVGF